MDLRTRCVGCIDKRGHVHPEANALASMFMAESDKPAGNVDNAALDFLLAEAQEIAARSYSPYSGFKVGAALRLSNGEVVTGTNVESTSYSLTICAERAALAQAVSRFGPGIRVVAIAVANRNGAASAPCGACRQMLAEFAAAETPVAFPAEDGIRILTLGKLLPEAFRLETK